jgi:hypothetical protein
VNLILEDQRKIIFSEELLARTNLVSLVSAVDSSSSCRIEFNRFYQYGQTVFHALSPFIIFHFHFHFHLMNARID